MAKNDFGYSEKIPENIRDVFMWLCQDVASLQHKWDFWLELFGKSENTDLLSELAPASFNIILETLQNDITMAICRLSDPPKSVGQENLSFATLAKNCIKVEGIESLVTEFQKICKPVRQRRNKKVGHRDLNSAIKPLEYPLQGVSKEQIDTIVKTAADILNFVLQNYENAEMSFHTISPGDAKALMFWLKKGKASKNRA
ncbi:MAG: hypothetical protein K8S20_05070 [Chloroflexi bacterium]|nr:hypothetical protein [Chloroflexota bacterium]